MRVVVISFLPQDVALAHYFEGLVRSSRDFEVTSEVKLGLVCFRLKNDDENKKTKRLLEAIQVGRR